MTRGPSLQTEPLLNNSPQSYYTGVVERLRFDAKQLRKMSAACQFAGNQTSVRVTDPSGLLADLDEAATAISDLQSDRDALKHDIERHLGIIAELESSLSRIKSETVEAAAEIVDSACERILSKQTTPVDPSSYEEVININLRMIACVLPDISSAIRSLSTDDAEGSGRNSTRNEGPR